MPDQNSTDAKSTGGLARLHDIKRELEHGGFVRFVWSNGCPMLMHADGQRFTTIDGRSYQAFCKTADKRYSRTETGSTGTKDLVIEWRK
jgi:hypothetical protein